MEKNDFYVKIVHCRETFAHLMDFGENKCKFCCDFRAYGNCNCQCHCSGDGNDFAGVIMLHKDEDDDGNEGINGGGLCRAPKPGAPNQWFKPPPGFHPRCKLESSDGDGDPGFGENNVVHNKKTVVNIERLTEFLIFS